MSYIPDRYAEGYGLSQQGIDKAVAEGVKLLFTLDCGIKAVDLIADANQKGIDVIVCDHHTPGEQLPAAHAVAPSTAGAPWHPQLQTHHLPSCLNPP